MTITLRSVKGSALTHAELDANFTDLNSNKASTANPNLTSPTISGLFTHDGAEVVAPNAMGALAIDVTKQLNTKSISANSTFTFSATATTNAWFGLHLTNSDTAGHVITIPSSYSMLRNATITTFTIPASSQLWLVWRYDGSTYRLFGEPGSNGLNNFAASSNPTINDDSADGYGPGSLWVNTTTPAAYICITAGAGAADWNQIDAAGGGSVATDTIFDAAGDLVQGTGSNTAARLAIGTALQVLQVNSGATAVEWGSVTGTGSSVRATSPTLTTPVLGTPSSGNLSNCTADGTNSVGFLTVPSNSQSAAYTCVIGDSGKSIDHPSTDANARTFTIPANSSVAYPVGTCLSFSNMTSQVVTIAITTDTMYLAGTGTTGSRSLAQYGMATARKLTSTTWIISGIGLT